MCGIFYVQHFLQNTDSTTKKHNKHKLSDLAYKTAVKAKVEAKAAAEGKLAALGLTTDDLRALGL